MPSDPVTCTSYGQHRRAHIGAHLIDRTDHSEALPSTAAIGAVALAGALALTLTACGSDDPIGDRPTARPAPPMHRPAT